MIAKHRIILRNERIPRVQFIGSSDDTTVGVVSLAYGRSLDIDTDRMRVV